MANRRNSKNVSSCVLASEVLQVAHECEPSGQSAHNKRSDTLEGCVANRVFGFWYQIQAHADLKCAVFLVREYGWRGSIHASVQTLARPFSHDLRST